LDKYKPFIKGKKFARFASFQQRWLEHINDYLESAEVRLRMVVFKLPCQAKQNGTGYGRELLPQPQRKNSPLKSTNRG